MLEEGYVVSLSYHMGFIIGNIGIEKKYVAGKKMIGTFESDSNLVRYVAYCTVVPDSNNDISRKTNNCYKELRQETELSHMRA